MTNNITQAQREQFWEDPDITNQPNQSIMDLDGLRDNYAHYIVDGLDLDSTVELAFEYIRGNLQSYTEKELIAEIVDNYDQETLEGLTEH